MGESGSINAMDSGAGLDAQSAIAAARETILSEADALKALAAAFDGPLGAAFARACEIIQAASGRVIVTGMGKSAHIGRKMTATFASTGRPSYFVHPGEASHGDLGMITAVDAVVALSNSGETFELADIINYTRRWSIPLIAITSRAGSALGSAADVTLLLPNLGEAGSMGIAPTTSTTMMLALGDALAVALLERKGFSADDFRQLHPGGKLGQKLLRVADLMHVGKELPLIGEDAGMQDAILTITAKTYGCVGVVNPAGDLVGIITDGDLRRHMSENLLSQAVDDVMTKNPKTIRPDQLAGEAMGILNAMKVNVLFVVENRKPVGLVRFHDLLRIGVA